MKRPLEISIEGTTFFAIDDAMGMLCSSNASPILIALLLRLSKRTRRKVWDFLVDHNKCSHSWYDEFCQLLWLHREKRPKEPITFRNLHPTFVVAGEARFTAESMKERYHIGKILADRSRQANADVLVGANYSDSGNLKISYPGWEMSHNIEMSTFFEWYFVACATAIRMDRMILHNALIRWVGDPIVPHDKTLYII